jgi:DNA polymerase-4
MEQERIIDISISDFSAAIALSKNPTLKKESFVIANSLNRSIVLAVSTNARKEGLRAGMLVSHALRLNSSLKILHPDFKTLNQATSLLTKLASFYTPTYRVENNGNLFLDVGGTTRLFGPPIDCAVQLNKKIYEALNIESAIAVATNKLVAHVGTRAIKPQGIAQIKAGTEASFLAHQDIALLPGVGSATEKLLKAAGFYEIGQIATLTDCEAVALLGKRGLTLRDSALGIDYSPFATESKNRDKIYKKIDFSEEVLHLDLIKAAISSCCEEAGFEMRKNFLASCTITIKIYWVDGVTTEESKKFKIPLFYDNELIKAALLVTEKALTRRVRLRSLSLTLGELEKHKRQNSLFFLEKEQNKEKLQKAVDLNRSRFGLNSLKYASSLYI